MEKIDLLSLKESEIQEVMEEFGEKKYRGSQIFIDLHKKNINEIDEFKVIPKKLKEELKEKYYISKSEILEEFKSKLDSTKKYLIKLDDGNLIESVLMQYNYGNTICISTQVGCKMNCSFCATGKCGFVRDLLPGEILGQYYSIEKWIGERIDNIVLMGSGEPLDNFDNVLSFLENITSEKGKNLSYRNITLSTCGIVDKIYKLADFGKPLNLAISLHNPFEDERKKIMPIANKNTIEDIIKSCHYYFEKTGRRISMEYTLIEGKNTSDEHILRLVELVKDLNCHINLIPINSIDEYKSDRLKKETLENIKNILNKYRINVTIRKEKGSDISASCGQLRSNYLKIK